MTSLPVGEDSAVSKASFEHSEMQTLCAPGITDFSMSSVDTETFVSSIIISPSPGRVVVL